VDEEKEDVCRVEKDRATTLVTSDIVSALVLVYSELKMKMEKTFECSLLEKTKVNDSWVWSDSMFSRRGKMKFWNKSKSGGPKHLSLD